MHKVKISIVLTILLTISSFGQTNSNHDTNQTALKDTSTNEQLKDIKDQIAKIKKIINDNGKDDAYKIGSFTVKKFNDIQVYKYEKDSDPNERYKPINGVVVSLDSVVFLTKDGYIVELQVICENKKFTNGRAPIEISTDRLNKNDVLGYKNNEVNEYIFINEILQYISSRPYIPEDDYFVLTKNFSSHTLMKNVGLNSIFDIRLYSDALGVFAKKANGLVQTDVNLKQFIHRNNFFNRGIFLPLSYFKFNLNASKFDSKIGFTDSSTFNRSTLLQKNWLSSDLSFNAFHGWITKRSLSSYYIDFGCGFNLSDVAKSKDTSTLISYSLFLEPGLDIKISDNIGTNISSRFIWNYCHQLDFSNHQSERLFIRPNIGLYWNPKGNMASRVFGRVIYTADTQDKKNNFIQLQFGYSIVLSSLVKQ